MQIYPYCQRQKCSPVNVLSSDIRIMQIFAEVREIWGVKQESGCLRCRFSYLLLGIFSKSSSPRVKSATHSICVKLLHKHGKLTQCCRAFTLALARLSCLLSVINAETPKRVFLLQRLDLPASCATSRAIPTADKCNNSAAGELHPHGNRPTTCVIYVTLC